MYHYGSELEEQERKGMVVVTCGHRLVLSTMVQLYDGKLIRDMRDETNFLV